MSFTTQFFKTPRSQASTDRLSLASSRRRRSFLSATAAALFVLVSLPIGTAAYADHDRDHGRDRNWVASWGASPSDPAPPLSDQTVREHVRLSLGGDSIRILDSPTASGPSRWLWAQCMSHSRIAARPSLPGQTERSLSTARRRRPFPQAHRW